ncbi:DUF5067 domain-containing protein [Mammaliicoccus sciuri]|uniref:DUF5067 domain-containing protein n=1 Tax=Mammaliicoccus sciuri TaxID=1296 RepID=UPI0021D2953A|nr:DUF5067 domain-containing protein [Mammaliicoccus sciuri]UXU72902.1 DUF5067 domain-containing protein [Mammaliicoccus sciuri]
MKRVFVILFVAILVLSACGEKDKKETIKDSENKTESKKNKVGFKNDLVTLNKGSIKILDVKLRNANDETDGKETIVFTYEATNKTDEDFSAQAFWISAMKVYQENKNNENKLEVGSTPTTGNYKEYFENMTDTIKKNGKAKGVVAYNLEDDNDVTLKVIQGNTDKELGKKTYKLSNLERIEHTTTIDTQNQTQNNETTEKPTTQQENTTIETQQEPKSVEGKQDGISQKEYDRTKTTTHDESQMEEQPQGGQGGHPSAFDPSISKETQGELKTDEDGNEYIEATGLGQ